MIDIKDLDYHHQHCDDPTWAETYFLIFSCPEAAISGNAYILSRPNVGVTLGSVYVHQGICHNTWEADYSDAPMHLPTPEKFSDFTLDNGLSLMGSNNARDYHLRYDGRDGLCKFDLNFKGVMDPFDALDPQHNPMLKSFDSLEDATGADGWTGGHYDLVGHVTGELELYGKKYKIDCYDGLDRSWGPRLEWNGSPVSWIHMGFGDDLAFHLVMTLKMTPKSYESNELRFGYVTVDGETSGVVAAEVTGQNSGMLGTYREVKIRDAKGREWSMFGTAIAAAPWHTAYGSFISFQTLYRWTMGDRTAYSHTTEVIGQTTLGKHFSRLGKGYDK
ncbi:MAG: hypothetical protein M0Q95_08025 [Porticoccaceae bacterium]|nr:hypothetical protein [Porticoccaceae bacterium]